MASSGNATDTIMVTVLGVGEIALVIGVGFALSTMVGTPDTGNDLAKTVMPVIGILGGIVMLHTVMWYFYFTYHPLGMNLYFLISGSVAIIISLIALSITLITRA
jgi:hypothetical protein